MNTDDFDGKPGPERRGEDRAIDKGGLQKKWDKISQRLRAELGEELFASWFARMEPEELIGGKLVDMGRQDLHHLVVDRLRQEGGDFMMTTATARRQEDLVHQTGHANRGNGRSRQQGSSIIARL